MFLFGTRYFLIIMCAWLQRLRQFIFLYDSPNILHLSQRNNHEFLALERR
jgi:hypothetical protein